MFDAYLDRGGNFIDTADGYTNGTSETLDERETPRPSGTKRTGGAAAFAQWPANRCDRFATAVSRVPSAATPQRSSIVERMEVVS